MLNSNKIAVIIPCYKVKKSIFHVLESIPSFIDIIYVIDDNCPELSGDFVRKLNLPNVKVIFNKKNLGVGGAIINGYHQAYKDKIDIAVKIDGDGQMDPTIIKNFINPIILGEADYTKGNRFFSYETFKEMPIVRIFGNIVLSFLTKASSGYWKITDPTNGYTAINLSLVPFLHLNKINKRFFFESDMLFRLGILSAMVLDIPMYCKYQDEESNLKVTKIVAPFLFFNLANIIKRIFYKYYLRDFNVFSVILPIAISLMFFSFYFLYHLFVTYYIANLPSPIGSLFILFFSFFISLQMFLGFIFYDVNSTPNKSISKMFKNIRL